MTDLNDCTLILLGGEIHNESLLQRLLATSGRIIAADGAAEFARTHGVRLHAVVGDFDSITPETLAFYREAGAKILHKPDQYSNDFEKALHLAVGLSAKYVTVLGISGGRLDHTLTNLSVMRRFADRFEMLEAFDDSSRLFYLTKSKSSHSFTEPVGARVSLMPMDKAHGVNTRGLHYPITDASMMFGLHEGLSNVIVSEPASVSIASGGLLVAIAIDGVEEGNHG